MIRISSSETQILIKICYKSVGVKYIIFFALFFSLAKVTIISSLNVYSTFLTVLLDTVNPSSI